LVFQTLSLCWIDLKEQSFWSKNLVSVKYKNVQLDSSVCII